MCRGATAAPRGRAQAASFSEDDKRAIVGLAAAFDARAEAHGLLAAIAGAAADYLTGAGTPPAAEARVPEPDGYRARTPLRRRGADMAASYAGASRCGAGSEHAGSSGTAGVLAGAKTVHSDLDDDFDAFDDSTLAAAAGGGGATSGGDTVFLSARNMDSTLRGRPADAPPPPAPSSMSQSDVFFDCVDGGGMSRQWRSAALKPPARPNSNSEYLARSWYAQRGLCERVDPRTFTRTHTCDCVTGHLCETFDVKRLFSCA